MAEYSNILLVDDYAVNLELLEAFLERSGIPMNIYKANTGREAFQYVEQLNLDMILLDVMLPDVSGYEICQSLKGCKQYQNIPIIMITALNDKNSMLKGLRAGADEFLTKPVDSHELILRVKNLLKMKNIANDLDNRYSQLHKELVIARELQKSFLPKQVPQYEALEIEVLYKASSFISGDFYDFFELDAQHLGVLICDVKGHGVASAMITATIKFHMHDLRSYLYEPEQLLGRLNERMEHFFSTTANDYFVTAFYGIIDLRNHSVCYSNAGHCTPVLCRKEEMISLDNEEGLPLGILPCMSYDRKIINIQTGDELFLYTDGIFEMELNHKPGKTCTSLSDVFEGDEDPVGIDKIHELQKEIRTYSERYQITDDINYIAIRVNE